MPQKPADWRFAHPDATMVGGLRVSALLTSPIVAAMLEDATAANPNAGAMLDILKTALGKVDEVRFSLLDLGNQQMDAVVMVSGEMDEGLAKVLSQGKVGARRINAGTLLLGSEEAMDAAVARMSEPPALLHNRALVRGSGMTDQDLWMAGNLPDTAMTAQLNLTLRGLAFGLSFHDDLAMELALDAASAEMASDLIRTAHEAEAKQPDMAGRLETSIEDTTATFRVRMPREEALAAIREGKVAQLFSQVVPGAGPEEADPHAAETLPPLPPQRKTIIIEGLDGGTKEIPMVGAH